MGRWISRRFSEAVGALVPQPIEDLRDEVLKRERLANESEFRCDGK